MLFSSNLNSSENYSEWERSNANNSSNKFSELDQINKANINQLSKAWIYKSGDNNINIETNPIFANNLLISSSGNDFVVAIDPSTGKEIWRLKLNGPVSKRGITYFKKNLFVPTNKGIFAVDISSGKVNKNIGSNGQYGKNLSFLPPIVTDKFVISANYYSDKSVESFDIKNGKLNWFINLNTYTNPRIWSGLSYDEKNEIIFITTSNPLYSFFDNYKNVAIDFCNSILAISAKTGEIIWQFQELKHDLWDLDIVGPPIVFDIMINKKLTPSVIALSKTGRVLFLNRLNGKPIDSSYLENRKLGGVYFDSNRDISKLSLEKFNYISHKIEKANFDLSKPLSIQNNKVFFGIHGGPEWPGAALNIYTNNLIVPFNKVPWIARAYLADKNDNLTEKLIEHNITYKNIYANKCSVCHGMNLQGSYQTEMEGSNYFPSLIGITKFKSKKELLSKQDFSNIHKYIYLYDDLLKKDPNQFYKLMNKNKLDDRGAEIKKMLKKLRLSKKVQNSICSFLKSNNAMNKLFLILEKTPNLTETVKSVTSEDLIQLYKIFRLIDTSIEERNDFETRAMYQALTDEEGLPASNPPWGYIAALNLPSGKMLWEKPFGVIYSKKLNKQYKGDINFGGVIITKSGVIFANGTRDSMAYAFDELSGNELWKAKLPASGSAPPMTYKLNGCQYIIFTATGGQYPGFTHADAIVAYKLKDCR